MKKILILGAGIYQLPLIKKAKELGYYVIVTSVKGNYPGFNLADKIYYEDTTNENAILSIAENESVDGICTTGTDVAMKSIGRVIDKLDLKGPSYAAAICSSNKLRMKEKLLEASVTTARFKEVSDLKDCYEAFELLEKPVVFKVLDSSGSRGVIKVEQHSEIESTYHKILKYTRLDHFIIEEFIEGEEFGAQAFIKNKQLVFVLAHGDLLFKGESIVPTGHYMPYDKPVEMLGTLIEKAALALEMDNCAINADLILKGDTIYFLEIAARAGATCLPELVSIHCGIDYYQFLIENAMGKECNMNFDEKNPCAAEILISRVSGKIKEIDIHRLDHRSIEDISLDYGVGDYIKKFEVGPDRIGQIVARGKSVREAIALLDRQKSSIKIEVDTNNN